MIKKAIYGTATAAALAAFVFGTDVLSYAKTAGSSVRNAVKAEVPIEFEVERAREMVENLVPDIRNCMEVIAEQQVDIERLGIGIARRDNDLNDQKLAMLALKNDLQSGQSTFQYASRTYTSNEVKRDLAKRLERFKVAKDSLDRSSQILAAREKALSANQKKLDTLLVAKQDLEVKIENIEARLKTLQAAEAASSLQIDDSQLTRVKKLIGEIDKQLDVKVKLLDAEGRFTGLIPVETKAEVPEDISGQIEEYFGEETPRADVAEADPSA